MHRREAALFVNRIRIFRLPDSWRIPSGTDGIIGPRNANIDQNRDNRARPENQETCCIRYFLPSFADSS